MMFAVQIGQKIRSSITTALLISVSVVGATAGEASAFTAGAQTPIDGFVRIQSERELYVDFTPPKKGRPIAVLLNGLTYRTGCWDAFVEPLSKSGVGILRYDPMGHGKTLARYGYPTGPFDYLDQVDDLERLLKALKISEPVHLITLSYGGALGMEFAVRHPKSVASLVLMAPYVAPLASQDTWIRNQIAQTRIMFPANPKSDDELYDFFFRSIVYSTYPAAEPIVLEHPFKLEATFRLAQGVRRFRGANVASKLPTGKVHLVLARQDQYVENQVHDDFWRIVPKRARASRLYIRGSEHKIPEAVPNYSAAWVKHIIAGDRRIQGDETFEGGPWTGTAKSEKETIELH